MCNFIESGNTLNYSLKKEKCFLGKRSEINAMKWLILISFSQLSSFLPALNNEEKNQYPNPYSRGSQTFSQKGRMRLQCNLKGPELFLEGGVRICALPSAKREVPCGRGPGPAQGPWKLWGYWCSLMQSQPYFGPFTVCLKPFFITFTAIFYALYFIQL